MVDPRGSRLLFFMFIRPPPYTCLGIEWQRLAQRAALTIPSTGGVAMAKRVSAGRVFKYTVACKIQNFATEGTGGGCYPIVGGNRARGRGFARGGLF